jgi:putative hemolysin
MMASNVTMTTHWADSQEEVREAQRLRYRVFVEEMGARIVPPTGTPPGLDADRFDAYCDHLLVRAAGSGGADGQLIGTYRVMTPDAARRAGGYYADTEFDLAPLASLRRGALELGRSCVAPEWRSGSVIMALWSVLGRYMLERELDTVIGCVSVPLNGRGSDAVRLWRQLCRTHLVEQKWRVLPHVALPLPDLSASITEAAVPVAPPALLKGYLRCGGRLLGPPALDVDFNTADLPMMLRIDEVAPRYRQHFLKVADTALS